MFKWDFGNVSEILLDVEINERPIIELEIILSNSFIANFGQERSEFGASFHSLSVTLKIENKVANIFPRGNCMKVK